MDWNAEAIERLRSLWTEGLSTAEIGRRLNISKNAVVGKAHRLALVARPSPIRRDPDAAPRPRRTARRHHHGATLPPLSAAPETPAELRGPSIEAPPSFSAERAEERAGEFQCVSNQPDVVQPVLHHSDNSAPEQADSGLSSSSLVEPQPENREAPRADVAPALPSPLSVVAAARQSSRPTDGSPRPSQRNTACCWPIGEPGTASFHFCGKAATTGRPYCEAHAEIAYVRVRDRRDHAA